MSRRRDASTNAMSRFVSSTGPSIARSAASSVYSALVATFTRVTVTVSLALPPLLLAAGPAAGDRSVRYRSVYLPVAAGLLAGRVLLVHLIRAAAQALALLTFPVLATALSAAAGLLLLLPASGAGVLLLAVVAAIAVLVGHFRQAPLKPLDSRTGD